MERHEDSQRENEVNDVVVEAVLAPCQCKITSAKKSSLNFRHSFYCAHCWQPLSAYVTIMRARCVHSTRLIPSTLS